MYAKWLAYGTCPWPGRRGSEWSCKTTVNLHGQRVEPWSVLPCCSVGVLRKYNAWGRKSCWHHEFSNFPKPNANSLPSIPSGRGLAKWSSEASCPARKKQGNWHGLLLHVITIIFLAWPHRLEIYSILLRSFSSIYATSVDNDESLVVSTNRGSFLRVLVFSTQMMWCCLKTGFCHESLLFKVWGWCHPKFGGAQTLSI